MPDFLPRRDEDLFTWSNNFDALLSSASEDYGISVSQAAEFHALHEMWVTLYQTAKAPGSRTLPSIHEKDAARDAMKSDARKLAGIVRATAGVTDAQRIALGIRPRTVRRKSLIPAPENAPGVHELSRMGQTVRVRLSDPDSPTRTARPRGALGAAIFIHYPGAIAGNADGWQLYKQVSLTTVDVTFPPHLPPGTRVAIAAEWISPTHGRGPMSQALGTWLAGGVPAVANKLRVAA